MTKFNTKIELNNDIIFIMEQKSKIIEKEFFNLFFKKSKRYILNDDGSETGLGKDLKKFDISPNKEIGSEWSFEVNKKSKTIMKKLFEANLTKGHRQWTLDGNGFSLTYTELGDKYDLIKGPDGQKTIYNFIVIKAKGNDLKKVNHILTQYKILK